MVDSPLLLPNPRQINLDGDTYNLPSHALLVISDAKLLFEAKRVQEALKQYAQINWEIVAGISYLNIGLALELDEDFPHDQGYQLSITTLDISIRAKDAAGIFYGVCTLNQLIQQY